MVSRPLISEEVANKIKTMIIDGNIEVGARLPAEQELAQKFNVSIRSIREAVKSLVSCNVLEVRRGVGTFVCSTPGVSDDPLGLEFMNLDMLYPDLMEVRSILEPEVFVLAAHRGNEKDFKKADVILEKIQQLNERLVHSQTTETDEELFEQFWQYDIAFHRCFYNTIHNLYQSASFKSFRKSPDFYSRHQAILDAVRAKDDEAIRQLCRLHISSGGKEGKLL